MNNTTAFPLEWLKASPPGHIVQFYPYDEVLINSLATYVKEGLADGKFCVMIASQRHLNQLENCLLRDRIDIWQAQREGNYTSLEAAQALADSMVGDMPNPKKIRQVIEPVLDKAKGRQIQAFGEMAALLWQRENFKGLMELEKLWDRLAKKYGFTIYCAYPQLHFDKDLHQPALNQICKTHMAFSFA